MNKNIITSEELHSFMDATYKVITLVPLVHGPYRNTYEFTQEEFNNFLEDYNLFGEFIIAVERI